MGSAMRGKICLQVVSLENLLKHMYILGPSITKCGHIFFAFDTSASNVYALETE